MDPTLTKFNGCTVAGFYSYAGTGASTAGVPHFVVGAVFENENGGNMDNSGAATAALSMSGVMMGASIGVLSQAEITFLDTANMIKKGNGSGYVIYK